MGGFFHSLATGMKAIGKSAVEGLPGTQLRQRHDQNQQNKEIQAQEADRQQREADLALHEHMMQYGRPSVGGTVMDEQPESSVDPVEMDIPGGGKATITLPKLPAVQYARPVDKSRMVTPFKDRSVGYELYTPEELAQRQARLKEPGLQQNVEQARSTAEATAVGHGAGTTAAREADLQNRGVTLSDDQAKSYGLQPGMKITPEEMVSLSRGIVPATIRNQGAFDRTKYAADVRARAAEIKQQGDAEFKKRQLEYQDKWKNLAEAGRNSRNATNQAGLNSRVNSKIGVDQKLHSSLLKDAYQEEQKQLEAQALLEETEQPGYFGTSIGAGKAPAVQDGEQFNDPWTGKKLVMSPAQRQRIKFALDRSMNRHESLTSQASQIAQRYGLEPADQGAQDTPGPDEQPNNPQPPATAAPATPRAATPPAAAPKPAAPKVMSKAQVAAAAKKLGVTPAVAEAKYAALGIKVTP